MLAAPAAVLTNPTKAVTHSYLLDFAKEIRQQFVQRDRRIDALELALEVERSHSKQLTASLNAEREYATQLSARLDAEDHRVAMLARRVSRIDGKELE